MSEQENLLKAYNYGNYARTIRNQINLLRIELDKKLQYSENGGIFKITPEFIAYVKAYLDQGSYRAIFLDSHKNPILIKNVESFFREIMKKEKEVLNEYYQNVNEIRKIRNLKEMHNE